MHRKQAYRTGFIQFEMLGMRTNERVEILEEREHTYIIRQAYNCPAYEVEKYKVLVKP